MLVSPLARSSFPLGGTEESSPNRPAKDIDEFNSLLPGPRIQFLEGSSTGLAVAEGKYEPINVSPEHDKLQNGSVGHAPRPPKRSSATPRPDAATATSLHEGVIDTNWPNNCSVGVGFYNTGNSCFLNSALQCLLHTAPLLRVLLLHKDQCRVTNGFCMACTLRETAASAHTKSSPFVPPVTNKLQLIAKGMRRGRQEDSHEFLRYAVDALQKSCLAGLPPKLDSKIAETTWVHKIFGGRLRSRVSCRECGHNSDTFDSILDLSLDIYNVETLRGALKKFVAVDHLKGADKYKCEKCKKPVVAEKQFTVHQAPVVLTIHFKRFSPLGRKIGHHVVYDERLSLQPVMSDGEYGPSYSLYGLICHAGGGPNSGHYYACVKGADRRWYEMNDESVTSLHSAPTNKKNAYMLFYLRDPPSAAERPAPPPMLAPSALPKTGLAAGMKKRKVVDSEADNAVAGSSKPFIGPLLPPERQRAPIAVPAAPVADPQANSLRQKIERANASKSAAASTLQSLSQYGEDGEEGEEGEALSSSPSATTGSIPLSTTTSLTTVASSGKDDMPPSSPPPSSLGPTSSPEKAAASSSDLSLPPSSPPGPPSPRTPTAPARVIPAPQFYAASASKKRKSPDGDESGRDLSRRDSGTPTSRRHRFGLNQASTAQFRGSGKKLKKNPLQNPLASIGVGRRQTSMQMNHYRKRPKPIC